MTVPVDRSAEIQLQYGSPYVIARIRDESDPKRVFSTSHEVTQRGLDLVAAQGYPYLSTRDASEDHFIWWRESSQQILRFVSICDLNVEISADGSVDDGSGKVEGQLLAPIPYHDSFRYIRLAATTEDLFDAFRNMYLAFEALLNHVAQRVRKEQEGIWIKRALGVVNSAIALSDVYVPAVEDVVERIFNEIYLEIRCPLFHSKQGDSLLPHSIDAKRKVGDGLRVVSKVVERITHQYLGTRQSGGGVTYHGFDHMMSAGFHTSQVIVSDWMKPFDPNEGLSSPAYSNAVSMETRHAPELSTPGLSYVIGSVEETAIRSLQRISRFGVKTGDQLVLGTDVTADLRLGGVDRLEAQLGIELRNMRERKRPYEV